VEPSPETPSASNQTEQRAPKTVGGLLIRRLTTIDGPVRELLGAKNFCTVCTLTKDGGVHAQPVWVDTDGDNVLLNSVPGRAWVRNLERNPRVTCTVINLQNPYEFVEIRGRVAERTEEGAESHIHRLAKKYLEVEEYPWLSPDEPRILFRVAPEKVIHMYPAGAELQS
jgi:PPOX class probable F420-dependent enzyme